MPNIEFNCTNCCEHLSVDAIGAGITVSCPSCKQQVLIPVSQANKTIVPPIPQPPPVAVKRASAAKSYRWVWITLLLLFTAIAVPISREQGRVCIFIHSVCDARFCSAHRGQFHTFIHLITSLICYNNPRLGNPSGREQGAEGVDVAEDDRGDRAEALVALRADDLAALQRGL